ncbi:hypothetical protein [Streptomyces sp. HPF1205]|uniref:hypothetical protein n=1 Tax=Streptomyces sp. HPF1205 TaxID=2873262 RepID=UPI001CED07C5|nr:hypothetical protein [Streptomyces sp. HPF1205]
MLLWEAVASAALGLLAACAAARLFPLRFSLTPLLVLTGTGAGLTGGLVMYTILGGRHPAAVLPTALATAAALTSILARPPKKGRHARVRSA